MLSVLLALQITFVGVSPKLNVDWKQEPTSFLGVKLGKPISASYPECTRIITGGRKVYSPIAGTICWEHKGNVLELMRAGEFFKIEIESIDGKVASVSASFKHSDFDKIERELIGLWGEPHWRNHPPTNVIGVGNLSTKGLNWFGKEIEIFCESQSAYRDEGVMGVSNRAYIDWIEKTASE